MHSHVVVYVPSSMVKDILAHIDPKGKRGKWIDVLLEYDLDMRPTKLVKYQGLAKLIAKSRYDVLGINLMEDVLENIEEEKVL